MNERDDSGDSVTERAHALLERIDRINAELNAYVHVDADLVIAEAQRLDALVPDARGPLHGMTIGVKDLIDVAGMPTRAGSAFFRRDPSLDAPVVRVLRDAGALIAGKTNTHEFAWGVTTENPHFGRTKNPWDLARIAGGSSGGSGAAIAAGIADAAIGTDTLGSIRVPSSCCGTSGIRPATGVLSIDGIFPLTPELDTPGPMARSVAQVMLLYAVMTGAPAERIERPIRLGRIRGGAWDTVTPALQSAMDEAAAALEAESVSVVDVAWFDDDLYRAVGIVQFAAIPAIHGEFYADATNHYGDDLRDRIERALTKPGDIDAARTTIARARSAFETATRDLDGVLMPIIPGEPPFAPTIPEFRLSVLPLVTPASAFALPSLALPIGFGPARTPLGMQIVGTSRDVAPLFETGFRFQHATSWHERRPRAIAEQTDYEAMP